MSQDKPVLSDFDKWLRTVCFQKPTPEAYDLAKCAWEAAIVAPCCMDYENCSRACTPRGQWQAGQKMLAAPPHNDHEPPQDQQTTTPANEVKSAPASGSPDISELVQRLEAWAQYWRGGSSIHMLPENGLVDSLYEAAQVLRALEEERDETADRRTKPASGSPDEVSDG
jgi:hypothetical protein